MCTYEQVDIKKHKNSKKEKKRFVGSQKGIFGWFTEREHGEQGITPPKTGI